MNTDYSKPFVSDELSVCHEVVDGICPCDALEAVHNCDSLSGIGVPSFVHHRVENGKRHSLVDDSKSKDIDVCVAVLPVGSIHREIIRTLDRNQL